MNYVIKLLKETLRLEMVLLPSMQRKFKSGKYSADLPIYLKIKEKKAKEFIDAIKILEASSEARSISSNEQPKGICHCKELIQCHWLNNKLCYNTEDCGFK